MLADRQENAFRKLQQAKIEWQERLAYFEKELASTADASQKFKLKHEIDRCLEELSHIDKYLELSRNPARFQLLKSVKVEIERLLDKHLYKGSIINLDKEAQPKQVKKPRDDYHYAPNYLLPSKTKIIDFFNKKAVSGKLLILGEPGSGKTLSLLELAWQLILKAENEPGEPIPVRLSLSSWKNQKIEEWLVTESLSVYEGVSEKDIWNLLKNHQLLLLLDNLDELNHNQFKCVTAINKFLNSQYKPKYIVICSRLIEYERCFPKLQLNGAVCLKPLREKQIQEYFFEIERIEIWKSVQSDAKLLELIQKPLFLHLLTVAYKNISVERWQSINSKPSQHCYLFNAYIEFALGESNNKKHWLSWIAKRLEEQKEVDFLLEKMQFDWLQTKKQKMLYKIIVSFTVALVSMPIVIMIYICIEEKHEFSIIGMRLPAIMSVFLGFLIGFIFPNINPVETLKFPGKELIDAFNNSSMQERFLGALLNNINSNKIRDLMEILSFWRGTLIRTLIGMMVPITAPIRGLIRGLQGPDINIKRRNFPNQGIYKSALNVVIYAGVFALVLSLIGLAYGLLDSELNRKLTSLIGGLLGLLIGILYPGLAFVQHFALRLILYRNNYIPGNYVHFLEEVTKKKLLERIGGRYRFIHRLLQEHFAKYKWLERTIR